MKEKTSTETQEQLWRRLEGEAKRFYDKTNNFDYLNYVTAGMENAMATLSEDRELVEDSDRYWRIAVDSVRESISGNVETEVQFARVSKWFARRGFTI